MANKSESEVISSTYKTLTMYHCQQQKSTPFKKISVHCKRVTLNYHDNVGECLRIFNKDFIACKLAQKSCQNTNNIKIKHRRGQEHLLPGQMHSKRHSTGAGDIFHASCVLSLRDEERELETGGSGWNSCLVTYLLFLESGPFPYFWCPYLTIFPHCSN